MRTSENLYYTKDHEWVRFENNKVTIGITDFAQGELGDIIFIEFPEIGQEIRRGDPFGTIEAVKTVADLFLPVSGRIIRINDTLENSPDLVNSDPYGDGWLLEIEASDVTEKEDLLSATEYDSIIA